MNIHVDRHKQWYIPDICRNMTCLINVILIFIGRGTFPSKSKWRKILQIKIINESKDLFFETLVAQVPSLKIFTPIGLHLKCMLLAISHEILGIKWVAKTCNDTEFIYASLQFNCLTGLY
jgi:hypothetical protein